MVRALIEDRKTQTRRICKGARELSRAADWPLDTCPYGHPRDQLWVRETHWIDVRQPSVAVMDIDGACMYSPSDTYSDKAAAVVDIAKIRSNPFWRKHPSIHMPRWASRITLEVTEVRVQRVQEISEEDALAEGCRSQIRHSAAFADLWDSINAARGFGWDANPWVWALTFKRLEFRQ